MSENNAAQEAISAAAIAETAPSFHIRRLLTDRQMKMIDQFPGPEDIKERTTGGGSVNYIQKDHIIDALNEIFGLEWVSVEASELSVITTHTGTTTRQNRSTREQEVVPAYIAVFSCRVTITITIPEDDSSLPNHKFSVSAYGTDSQTGAERNGSLPITETIEMAAKGANTNALKRAAEQIGRYFGLDVKSAPRTRATNNPNARPARQGSGFLDRFNKKPAESAPDETNKKAEQQANPAPKNTTPNKTQNEPQNRQENQNSGQPENNQVVTETQQNPPQPPIEPKNTSGDPVNTNWKGRLKEIFDQTSELNNDNDNYDPIAKKLRELIMDMRSANQTLPESFGAWFERLRTRTIEKANSLSAEHVEKFTILYDQATS